MCKDSIQNIMLSYLTAIDINSTDIVELFPNPSNGIINISAGNADINTVEIVNVQGQVVRSINVRSNKAQINLESLPSGLYYARVNIGSAVEVKKIMLK